MQASEFELDLAAVAELWRHGSVVRSWLLDLLARALDENPGLEHIRGYVEDSGEGRWTVEQAIDTAVPLHVITAALYARFASREDESFSAKVNAALGSSSVVMRSVETETRENPLLEGLQPAVDPSRAC